MWQCPDDPSKDSEGDEGVEFFIDEGEAEQPQWKLCWQCRPATPVHQLKFSPDGLLFASVGKVSIQIIYYIRCSLYLYTCILDLNVQHVAFLCACTIACWKKNRNSKNQYHFKSTHLESQHEDDVGCFYVSYVSYLSLCRMTGSSKFGTKTRKVIQSCNHFVVNFAFFIHV